MKPIFCEVKMKKDIILDGTGRLGGSWYVVR